MAVDARPDLLNGPRNVHGVPAMLNFDNVPKLKI